jgi:flagellar M-ring protein FliF
VATVINNVTREVKKGDKTEKQIQPRSDEQMRQLEQIVRQAVGIDPLRNDQISIINMSFESPGSVENNPEEEVTGNNVDKYVNLVVIIASIIAAMFVLRTLLKKLKNEKIVISTYGQEFDSFQPTISSIPKVEKQIAEPTKIFEDKKIIQAPKKKRPLIEVGDITDEISDEALSKQVRQEKLTHYVAQNPIEAARLINLWLREDEY